VKYISHATFCHLKWEVLICRKVVEDDIIGDVKSTRFFNSNILFPESAKKNSRASRKEPRVSKVDYKLERISREKGLLCELNYELHIKPRD